MTTTQSRKALVRRLEHLIAREAVRSDLGGATSFDKQEISALRNAIQAIDYALSQGALFTMWVARNPKIDYRIKANGQSDK
jgi:hypothetical protein